MNKNGISEEKPICNKTGNEKFKNSNEKCRGEKIKYK